MSRKQQHPPLPTRATNRVFQSAFAVLAVISACAVGWYLSGAGIRIETAAVTLSVFDRGLVAKPTATSQSSILANHNRTSLQALSSRTLPSNFSTLCYVTPWNPSGAAAVRSHPHLFTHVSPVWHSVRFRDAPAGSPQGPVEAYLDGDNDVDVEWLSAITGKDIAASISWHDHAPRSAAPVFTSRAHAPLVVPRVLIEPSDARATSLLTSVSLQKQVVSLLQNLVRRYSYDGLVLEATFFWAVAGEYPDHPQHAYSAVAASPAALLLHQGQDKQSPPSVGSLGLTPADMASPRHSLNSFVTSLSSSLRAMEGPQRRILGLAVRPSPPTRIDARASDNASSKRSSEMQQAGARRGVFSSPLGAKHQQQHQRQHAQVFAAVDAVVVGDAVDFYSLMTYDYAPSSLADPFVESNLKSLREKGMQGDQLERSLRVYGWPASPLPWFTGAIAALSEADPASASTAAGANSEQRSVRSRILAGLNLYGMRHGHKSQPEPILGRDFVSILAENNATAMAARVGAVTVLGADGKALGTGLAAEKAVRGRMFAHHSGEHYFQRPLYSTEAGGRLRLSGEKETVWYPSLHSLWSRMEAAQAAGAGGVSAWECGQGLEYFFELF